MLVANFHSHLNILTLRKNENIFIRKYTLIAAVVSVEERLCVASDCDPTFKRCFFPLISISLNIKPIAMINKQLDKQSATFSVIQQHVRNFVMKNISINSFLKNAKYLSGSIKLFNYEIYLRES